MEWTRRSIPRRPPDRNRQASSAPSVGPTKHGEDMPATTPHCEALSLLRSSYDCVVIGSGYGGGVAASRMSRTKKCLSALNPGYEKWPGEYPAKDGEPRDDGTLHHVVVRNFPIGPPPSLLSSMTPSVVLKMFEDRDYVSLFRQEQAAYTGLTTPPAGYQLELVPRNSGALHFEAVLDLETDPLPPQTIGSYLIAVRHGLEDLAATTTPEFPKSRPILRDYDPGSRLRNEVHSFWGEARQLGKMAIDFVDGALPCVCAPVESPYLTEKEPAENGYWSALRGGIVEEFGMVRDLRQACFLATSLGTGKTPFGVTDVQNQIDLMPLQKDTSGLEDSPTYVESANEGTTGTAKLSRPVYYGSKALEALKRPLKDPG